MDSLSFEHCSGGGGGVRRPPPPPPPPGRRERNFCAVTFTSMVFLPSSSSFSFHFPASSSTFPFRVITPPPHFSPRHDTEESKHPEKPFLYFFVHAVQCADPPQPTRRPPPPKTTGRQLSRLSRSVSRRAAAAATRRQSLLMIPPPHARSGSELTAHLARTVVPLLVLLFNLVYWTIAFVHD